MSSDFANRLAPIRAIKRTLLAALVLGGCIGCSANSAGTLPSLIPVKGKVTFKGQPLSSGTVRFEPDDYGRPAEGKLQSDGTFVLSTFKEGDGVVKGHHRVSITNLDPKTKAGAVPKKQWFAATSKLEAEVSPEQTEFTFDIK